MKTKVHLLGCALLAAFTFTAHAFSLQGPVGRAVDLNEEYRWNVPIVTYAFDQSFIDYFGPDGVQAVQDAIDILNALPRASRINLESFPENTTRYNEDAFEHGLYDLKSVTLNTLIRQLGLASPTEHIFDQETSSSPIEFHNYDPVTLQPSSYVNGVLYTNLYYAFETPVDPLSSTWNAVADSPWYPGKYYTGLTRDDVGGLRYLLSRTNFNRELAPTLVSARNFISRRGGVEKILFVPFRLSRNSFVMRQPDFLFSAGGTNYFGPMMMQGGSWISCAAINGNPGGNGPGVIRGPVRITFGRIGPNVATSETDRFLMEQGWGSFDETNVTPLGAWQPERIRTATVRMYYWNSFSSHAFLTVQVPAPYGVTVALQISANNVDWTTLATVVNTGGIINWNHHANDEPAPQIYMRAVRFGESDSTGGSVSESGTDWFNYGGTFWYWSGELTPVGTPGGQMSP